MWQPILKVVLDNGGTYGTETEASSADRPKGLLIRNGPKPFVAYFWGIEAADEPNGFQLDTAKAHFSANWSQGYTNFVIYFDGLLDSNPASEEEVAARLLYFLSFE